MKTMCGVFIQIWLSLITATTGIARDLYFMFNIVILKQFDS